MRAMAYVVAVLAAAGIMIGIAVMPEPEKEVASTASVEPSPVSDHRVMDEAGSLVLAVPQMHCEFSCYPSVKQILEGADLVQSVELDAQKEEGTIDNRQVIVKYDAGFDLDAAINLLGQEGFKDSELVQ